MTRLYVAALAALTLLAIGTPRPTQALPAEYRISGFLTGDLGVLLGSVSLVDVPFEISIAADTADAFEFGNITGFGTAYVNDSVSATWSVDGLGTAASTRVQIFTLPGVSRVGFGWNGEVFPINTSEPAERIFQFTNAAFALETSYGHLDSVVPEVPLNLQTELENPPGTLPLYTTSILFPGEGPLVLKELTNLSYEVVAIPEPSTGSLTILGIFAILAQRRTVRG
jgi:hypothetical protein